MRTLIMTDLEGVAGVASFESQAYENGNYYEPAKELLTAEVNVAIEGMLCQGVEEFIVLDGHGPGAICFEKLHPEAQLVHGRPVAPSWRDRDEYGKIDFCVMIGQHAMAGVSDGNMNHTLVSRAIDWIKLNGEMVGETALFAYLQGLKRRPVIFLSGDRAACREAENLIPQIVTAEVKVGLARNCAMSLSQKKSHDLICDRISTAVQGFKANPFPGLTLEGPFMLEVRYFHTDAADNAQKCGFDKLDSQTVRYESNFLLDVLNKF